MIGKDCQGASKTMMGYMFSSFLQLAVESRDLSQAEKEINLFKAKQIHKMGIFFTQDLFDLSFCELIQVCKQLFLSQLEMNYVIQKLTEVN